MTIDLNFVEFKLTRRKDVRIDTPERRLGGIYATVQKHYSEFV